MSDNSKRKTWPSRRRKLKWRFDSSTYQEAVAGRRTRRPRQIFVTRVTGTGELAFRWGWGEVGAPYGHPAVDTEAEAKHLAEEEYHSWQKPTRYETIQEPADSRA